MNQQGHTLANAYGNGAAGDSHGSWSLEDALRWSLEPNNASRLQAEQAVRTWMKDPEAALTLIRIVQSSQYESSRHLGALLLRRKVNTIWKRLNDAQKNELKQVGATKTQALEVAPTTNWSFFPISSSRLSLTE